MISSRLSHCLHPSRTHGTLMALSWHSYDTLVALSWHSRGTLMALSWHGTAQDLKPSCSAATAPLRRT
eukprot:5325386-Alexandrium_andersonii.AAC.1